MIYDNKFVTAVSNLGTTENGALTFTTSGSNLVDFFFSGAVSEINKTEQLFHKAYNEDKLLALKIAFYLRDVREGQGKRDVIRATLKYLYYNDKNMFNNILPFVPLIGRWKDVFETVSILSDESLSVVYSMIEAGIEDDFHRSLIGKWAPRKGPNAKVLTKLLGVTDREYRKLVVGLSNTVEQKMCAKQWDDIDFSKLPSRAAKIYQKAFMRNAEEKYTKYVDSLVKGDKDVKVNASTLFPSDIVTALRNKRGNTDVLNAQWNALPDYMEASEHQNIFPVIDLSGSMCTNVHGSTTAMEVAIGLGLYVSTHNRGAYKNLWCNFSNTPKIFTLEGKNISDIIENLDYDNWGGSTDLQAVFSLILTRAINNRVPQEDMPSTIVIMSDMEFNSCARGTTNLEAIQEKYRASGYKIPMVVFWNIASRNNNSPATMNEKGVVLVGGYSPIIMKNILEVGFEPTTPIQMVINTIGDKYSYLDNL